MNCLLNFLPNEMIDNVAKQLHGSYQRDINNEIKNTIIGMHYDRRDAYELYNGNKDYYHHNVLDLYFDHRLGLNELYYAELNEEPPDF